MKGIDKIPFVLSFEAEEQAEVVFEKIKETGAGYQRVNDYRKGSPAQQREAHGEQIRSILIKHEAGIKTKAACFTALAKYARMVTF